MKVLLRAVAFDVDGTLYPNLPMLLLSALHAVPRLRFLRAFSRVRREIRQEYPIQDFPALQKQMLGDALGVTSGEAGKRIGTWLERDLDAVYRRLSPYPHVDACIHRLRSAGLKTGVLSDFPIGEKLRYLGLDGLWDCVLASEESGYLKPRPEPFLRLAECLDEPPEHIVYIGNSYEYDIVGAQRVGMKTAFLKKKRQHRGSADIAFSDYRELAPAILEFVRS